MGTATTPTPTPTVDEFDLDASFVESELGVPEAGSDPCTGDNCGRTADSAGVTC